MKYDTEARGILISHSKPVRTLSLGEDEEGVEHEETKVQITIPQV